MDYISEIRALAQEGLRCDPKYEIFGARIHKWQFGEPADIQKIYDFQNDMKITLPEALVRYLTELGDGGAGPDYGIYSLDKMRRENTFLPEAADLPVMLDHSMTDEQWIDFAKKYETLDNIIFSDEFDTKTEEQQESLMKKSNGMESSVLAGGLFIGTPGCTMNSVLMCRGAACGEVFIVDFDYLFQLRSEPFCCGKFEDWIIREMKKSIRG